MRIAHFYGHESANGVTWSIMDVSRLLTERGHDVQIFCRMDSSLKAYPRPYHVSLAGQVALCMAAAEASSILA